MINRPIELLRGRLLGKSLDALITSGYTDEHSLGEIWGSRGLHGRLEAVLRLLDRRVPELLARVRSASLRPVILDGERFELTPLSRGSTNTVYRVDDGKRVLKVHRESIGQSARLLRKMAHQVRTGQRTLAAWYRDCPGVLVSNETRIIRGPLLGLPAVVTLQPWVEGKQYDLLRDFSTPELHALFAADSVLRTQFLSFCRATAATLATGSRCFDMHGRDNLMLLHHANRWRLCVVDCGVYDLEARKRQVPAVYAEIQTLHHRLFELARELGG